MYISRIICPSANGAENAAKAAGAIGPCGFRSCGTTLRPHHIPTSTIIDNLLTYVLLRHPPPMGAARSKADSCSQAHVQSVQMFHVIHPHASTDLLRRAAKTKARRCRGNARRPGPVTGQKPPPRGDLGGYDRFRASEVSARRALHETKRAAGSTSFAAADSCATAALPDGGPSPECFT